MELVTLKTFDNSVDAHLLKAKLESEGITCFLFNENIVGLNPLYNITVGGIQLKIPKPEVDQAIEIIEQTSKSPLTRENGELIKCPRCQSEDIYASFKSMKGTKEVISAIVSFLLMVFPIYYKYVYRCKQCGNEFK